MQPPSAAERIAWLREMLRIRHFEDRVRTLFTQGRLPGFLHLYTGQEAIATGVSAGLEPGDQITSTHRGHGHVIARGGDLGRMFAELLGREDGYCRGKGGSMHIVDFAAGMLGTNGIVGGGIPIATGAAFANRWLENGQVAVAFFGDGATNQGVLFEALNLASLWKLPVIYVCENNQYTEWSRTEALTAGSIKDRPNPFSVPGVSVDGNDVEAVRAATLTAATRARRGEGPTFVEALTYRWYGHNEGEEAFSGAYRTRDEIAEWKERDPILLFRDRLLGEGLIDMTDYETLVAEAIAEVERAYEFGSASPVPDTAEALTDVFAPQGSE